MKCPFTNIDCVFIDTAGMFKIIECYDCENYSADSINTRKGTDVRKNSKKLKKSGRRNKGFTE